MAFSSQMTLLGSYIFTCQHTEYKLMVNLHHLTCEHGNQDSKFYSDSCSFEGALSGCALTAKLSSLEILSKTIFPWYWLTTLRNLRCLQRRLSSGDCVLLLQKTGFCFPAHRPVGSLSYNSIRPMPFLARSIAKFLGNGPKTQFADA